MTLREAAKALGTHPEKVRKALIEAHGPDWMQLRRGLLRRARTGGPAYILRRNLLAYETARRDPEAGWRDIYEEAVGGALGGDLPGAALAFDGWGESPEAWDRRRRLGLSHAKAHARRHGLRWPLPRTGRRAPAKPPRRA